MTRYCIAALEGKEEVPIAFLFYEVPEALVAQEIIDTGKKLLKEKGFADYIYVILQADDEATQYLWQMGVEGKGERRNIAVDSTGQNYMWR